MSPETESFLDNVRRAEDPTPEDERRVLAAVRLAVGAGAACAAAGAAVGGAKLGKSLLGFGIGGGKGVAVLVCLVAAAGVAVPFATQPTTGSAARTPPAALAPPRARPVDNGEPAPATPLDSASGSAPPPASPSAQRASAPAARTPIPAPVPAASLSTGRTLRAPTARDELSALARAQSALRDGDAGRALELLGEAAPGDPRFLAERRALRVLALCAAGRTQEALREAAEFRRAHPSSVQRGAVARSCAGDAVPAEH